MPFLVQLLVPTRDNAGNPFTSSDFQQLRQELTDRFGGVTAYTRTPAEGTWEDPSGRRKRDDVVVVEVMAEDLDRPWWRHYAGELAIRFRQEELVVRAIAFESLSVRESEA